MRAEMGSNTEPGWMHRRPARSARKRWRLSVQRIFLTTMSFRGGRTLAFERQNRNRAPASTGISGAAAHRVCWRAPPGEGRENDHLSTDRTDEAIAAGVELKR